MWGCNTQRPSWSSALLVITRSCLGQKQATSHPSKDPTPRLVTRWCLLQCATWMSCSSSKRSPCWRMGRHSSASRARKGAPRSSLSDGSPGSRTIHARGLTCWELTPTERLDVLKGPSARLANTSFLGIEAPRHKLRAPCRLRGHGSCPVGCHGSLLPVWKHEPGRHGLSWMRAVEQSGLPCLGEQVVRLCRVANSLSEGPRAGRAASRSGPGGSRGAAKSSD